MELDYIGQMGHDIQVNIWEKKGLDETRIVQDAIVPIMKKSKGNDEVIEATWGYFDLVYQKLSTNHHNEEGSSYH